jgi:glyoxylase-like metal-dependent hydrolase (beta-lactamase superfamily II)
MFRKCLTALFVIGMMTTVVMAQDAATVINNATRAMGVENLKTIQFSGSGFDFALGQNANPNLPWPKFTNKTYTRMVNFEAPASRVDRIRMQGENPPRGGGNQPVVGEQTQQQVIVVGPNTAWAQQLEIIMLPSGFLKAASANNATVREQTVRGRRYNILTFTGQNKARVNGYINDQNMVEKVETWIDNPMYGDMLFDVTYSDYKDFGGVKFPTRIIQRQGDHPILDLTLTDVRPNAPVTIQPPQQQGGGGGQAAATVPVEKLGDGVFLILGGYASLAIEFRDHIVVIEGGQSEARGLAVIAEAKKAIPNKPIRYVVNTHAHFDHSSGLRPFVAEGATIITHDVNKNFLDRLFKMPRTLNPDKMAQSGRTAKFETMKDKKVLSDGNQVVELHTMTNMGHHDGLLMVYLPKLKVLLEADGYNPGQANAAPPATPSPYNVALVANVERLKLDVQRIIPVHYPGDNRQITMAEVMRMIGRGSSN